MYVLTYLHMYTIIQHILKFIYKCMCTKGLLAYNDEKFNFEANKKHRPIVKIIQVFQPNNLSERVSDFQLNHGENTLFFNEMMMRSALY